MAVQGAARAQGRRRHGNRRASREGQRPGAHQPQSLAGDASRLGISGPQYVCAVPCRERRLATKIGTQACTSAAKADGRCAAAARAEVKGERLGMRGSSGYCLGHVLFRGYDDSSLRTVSMCRRWRCLVSLPRGEGRLKSTMRCSGAPGRRPGTAGDVGHCQSQMLAHTLQGHGILTLVWGHCVDDGRTGGWM